MAILEVIKGLNPGQLFPVEGEQAVMGRHPDCDIVLDVGAISRQHAQILKVGDDYFVEDLKSRNGTYVNSKMIEGRTRLQDNDELKICDLLFTFHLHQPGPKKLGLGDRAPEGSSVMMIDDLDATSAGSGSASNIMSSLNFETSRSGVFINVNPEVKLKALMEITRSLGSAISLDEVLPKVLDSLFKIFIQADRGFVVMKEPRSGVLVPKAIRHRREEDADTIRISKTIVKQVMDTKEAILSADAASDTRFEASQSIADFRIRSMICAPLVDSTGTSLGVIQVDTLDQRSRFKPDDLEVLASVASQASTAIEIAQMHDDALKKQALVRDLDLAHQVQQGILPGAPPVIEGYEFFDFYGSADQIGGDYFDYVPLPGHRLAVVLADVSGHGISAALLMAKLSSEAHYCLASEPMAAAAMKRLNATFSRGGWEDRFVTMIMAVIDLNTHQVTVANAGHMPPLLRRVDGKIEEMGDAESGVPLGVDIDYDYQQCSFALQPGESLTIFTDGISEAMNTDNELYGLERLKKAIQPAVPGVSALGGRILEDVKRFVGQRSQNDDMCLMCVGRKK